MIVDYIILIMCLVSMVMSALTGYFFYLSKNGELRKILIRKFATHAVFWGSMALIFPMEVDAWKKIVVCSALLVLNYWKLMLQIYLVKQTRKHGKV